MELKNFGILDYVGKNAVILGIHHQPRISMLVGYLSGLAIMVTPAEVYAHGIQIYNTTFLQIIFGPMAIPTFVKVFYNLKITSIYEYLEKRYESVVVRLLASGTFIVQHLLYNAMVLYTPALALDAIFGLPLWISISSVGLIATIYTAFGGIRAVVWTDCFQFAMIFIGVMAILIQGFTLAGGISKSFQIAKDNGRLVIFDFTFDPFVPRNFWNFIFGVGFRAFVDTGCTQMQFQRYCSVPTFNSAARSILVELPLKVFMYGLIYLMGLSVFAAYAGCDPLLLGNISKVDSIIPYFVVNVLSHIPGMVGLFVACVFSAVLSTISSTLNSLATVIWEDYMSKSKCIRGMTEERKTAFVRGIAIALGILSIGLAFTVQFMGQIFYLSHSLLGIFSGPLSGAYVCGVFLPWVNGIGILCGICISQTVMLYLGVQGFLLKRNHPNLDPMLPSSINECDANTTDFTNAKSLTHMLPPEFGYPDRIYTVSIFLYPIIGAVITIVIALVVGLLTGRLDYARKVPKKYLHSIAHFCNDDDGVIQSFEMGTDVKTRTSHL